MMKKNGFTLAEVLITLAIIGVVATMTLPALMTNTSEQQAKTGLKKAINTLVEGINMHEAITGINFDTMVNSTTALNADDDDTEGATIVAFLRARAAIDYAATGNGSNLVSPKQNGAVGAPEGTNKVAYLRDGSSIMYNSAAAFDTGVKDDNMTGGLVVVVDTNGKKGPNILSNCATFKLGSDETVAQFTAAAVDTTACNDKAKRVINDRFLVRLRGNVAQPEGLASVWAYNN